MNIYIMIVLGGIDFVVNECFVLSAISSDRLTIEYLLVGNASLCWIKMLEIVRYKTLSNGRGGFQIVFK